jgi:pimeloyl-ACP methyl ester carboxylesterase
LTSDVREHAVTFDDGTSTTLESWGDAGPIVLCVHGIASSRRSWTRLGRRLEPEFRVFAYDQRGHGDRAGDMSPMTLDRSVRDLEAVAASLPGRVHLLVGHSWGGAVALLGGRAITAERVVAIDPMLHVAPHTFDGEYVDDLRETLALEPVAKERAIRDMYAGADPVDIAGKVHAMLPMRIEALEALGRDNAADDGLWDIRETVVDYPVPLLACIAGDDSVLSADDLAFLRARGGPNLTVRVFEGEGHNLHRTAFDAFARAVIDFA